MADREKSPWLEYEQRLARVLAYIHDHLDEDLNLNRLAEVAYFSPYHFHRIYHAMLGETVPATVRRLRLHRAAGQLIETRLPVREIAAACGFNSSQAFARVFQSAFGMSPAQYRTHSAYKALPNPERKNFELMYDITIRSLPACIALTCEHIGPYMEIGRAFDRLSGTLAARNLFRPGLRMVALYYDDPSAVPTDQLRSRAGVVFPDGEPINTGLESAPIAGGEYAVLRHKGPYAELPRAYEWLYGQWLPQSGREAANSAVLEEYLNTPLNAAPTELLTDICLPLA